jgi:DNA uptake protein ComE-like DNA-binding protein
LAPMPTPSERRALLFLAGLMVLGSGVRASAALSGAERTPGGVGGQPALETQIAAVDTAWARQAKKKESKSRSRKTAGRRPRSTANTAISRSGGEVQRTIFYMAPEPGKIDLDVASAAEIERLPRIGPVLAARIVADRDSLGPFGSLEGLRRVKGVGPALARTVSSHVTFSLRPRPSGVNEGSGEARPGGARRRPHRSESP